MRPPFWRTTVGTELIEYSWFKTFFLQPKDLYYLDSKSWHSPHISVVISVSWNPHNNYNPVVKWLHCDPKCQLVPYSQIHRIPADKIWYLSADRSIWYNSAILFFGISDCRLWIDEHPVHNTDMQISKCIILLLFIHWSYLPFLFLVTLNVQTTVSMSKRQSFFHKQPNDLFFSA